MADQKITNLATYKVRCTIANEEPEHDMWLSRAKTGISTYELSVEMKEYYIENNPLSSYIMVYSDLLGWALACVNWMEVAEEFVEAAKEAENYAAISI